jgi:carbon-monoxide dehydrogenase iron sulfur subunit
LAYIYCDPDLCTGCRSCEVVCSGFHERVFSPRKSRIRAVQIDPDVDVAVTCRHCADAPCAQVCPEGAIHRSPSGLVWVDVQRCIGCGMCTEACPFGAIWLHPDTKKAIKCDLCGGDPQCVKQCPTNALSFKTPEQVAGDKRREFVRTLERSKLKKAGLR